MKWFLRVSIIVLLLSIGIYSYDKFVANKRNIPNQNLTKVIDVPKEVQNAEIEVKPNCLPLLVNKTHPVDSNYIPKNLTIVNVALSKTIQNESKMMNSEAAKALEDLFKEADNEGIKLFCISGYRSFETQKLIYDSKVRAVGKIEAEKYVAIPGESEHQTGLAMDVGIESMVNSTLESSFGETKEGIWIKDNSYKFGFIIRYPKGKEDVTGYNYEPWHIRYVGKEIANEITKSGITLEEYLKVQE